MQNIIHSQDDKNIYFGFWVDTMIKGSWKKSSEGETFKKIKLCKFVGDRACN